MNKPAEENPRAISRTRLEAVIRRAAELYAAEADADDGISESELFRIADELGLPAPFVRQALYEISGEPSRPSLIDRISAPPTLTVGRVVPGEAGAIFRELEEYLVTREYFQLKRRQGGRAWFTPADDFLSGIARSFTRPSSRNALAHARGVSLAVDPLEEGRSYTRVDLDYRPARRSLLLSGGILGAFPFGLLIGGGIAGAAEIMTGGIGAGTIIGTMGASMAASAAGGVAIAAGHFRKLLGRAAGETHGLLDRLEAGDRLDPPPPPWRRRLQKHLRGL